MSGSSFKSGACAVAATVLLAGSLGLSGCNEVSDRDIRSINVGRVQQLRADLAGGEDDAIIMLDPRSARAFEAEHIPGARRLTADQVARDAGTDPTIDRFDTIVVYAENPGSAPARALTKRLMEVGYDDVFFFDGGLREWKASGLPTDGTASGN